MKSFKLSGIVLAALLILLGCEDPYQNTTYKPYDVNPASTYLEAHPEKFSEWIAVLKYADLFNAINQATKAYTVLVPNNEAVKQFYQKEGISSIKDLSKDYVRNLAKYHIIGDSINLNTFATGGQLASRTLSDDPLTVTFDEDAGGSGGYNSMQINNEARVEEVAIRVSNGYIYVLNGVLSPLIETVYDRVAESGKYNIMKEAIEKTSWRDTLNIKYDTIVSPTAGVLITKREYTFLGVSDETFAKSGISSFADLVSKLSANNDFTNRANPLNQYVAYHILKGYFTVSNLQTIREGDTSKLIPTESGTIMEMDLVGGACYINYNGVNTSGDSIKARFVEANSDVIAKNGVVHEVDGYLPVWEPGDPVKVIWDFVDAAEVKAYIDAKGDPQKYQSYGSAEDFSDISSLKMFQWSMPSGSPANTGTPAINAVIGGNNNVVYFTFKTGGSFSGKGLNNDMLIINLGYLGEISMQTPYIIKGRYKITLYFGYSTSQDFIRTKKESSNGGLMNFYLDGKNQVSSSFYTTVTANTLSIYNAVIWNEITFDTTSTHTFKLVVMDPTAQTHQKHRYQLDYLLFEPITTEP